VTQIWAEALALPGLWLLLFGAVLAGLVRGFSGFGTALVFVPIAAQIVPPVWVITMMLVMDLIGPIPAIPRALRDGVPSEILRLGAGALVGIPFGLALLLAMDPTVFRYVVAGITSLLLVLLISGVRYNGVVRKPMLYGIGGLSGLLSGSVGIGGPPVIMLYMMRPLPPAVIRANAFLFLVLIDILAISIFAAKGVLEATPLILGLILTPIYLSAIWIGGLIFDPSRETVYRWVAYTIIAGSVLNGLPIWD